MKRYFLLFAISLFVFPLTGQDWKTEDVLVFEKYDQMAYIFEQESDTTYLINFWATWCKPCVKELPYIEEVATQMENKKYKSLLVSLDFERQIESRLIPFLNKNQISSEVILLADPKSSTWIDKVEHEWSGVIPMTIVYRGDKRSFYEQEFHSPQEILEIVNTFIID